MPTNPLISLSLACYNVDRFVASSLFCVRLYLKSYIAVLIYFDGAEIKDTTTTTYGNVKCSPIISCCCHLDIKKF